MSCFAEERDGEVSHVVVEDDIPSGVVAMQVRVAHHVHVIRRDACLPEQVANVSRRASLLHLWPDRRIDATEAGVEEDGEAGGAEEHAAKRQRRLPVRPRRRALRLREGGEHPARWTGDCSVGEHRDAHAADLELIERGDGSLFGGRDRARGQTQWAAAQARRRRCEWRRREFG